MILLIIFFPCPERIPQNFIPFPYCDCLASCMYVNKPWSHFISIVTLFLVNFLLSLGFLTFHGGLLWWVVLFSNLFASLYLGWFHQPWTSFYPLFHSFILEYLPFCSSYAHQTLKITNYPFISFSSSLKLNRKLNIDLTCPFFHSR